MKKLKQALAVIGMKPVPPATDFLSRNSVQEDTKLQELRKRINKHFDEQMGLINERAMMPHDPDPEVCPDRLECRRNPCWTWQADKIVGDPYVVKSFMYSPMVSVWNGKEGEESALINRQLCCCYGGHEQSSDETKDCCCYDESIHVFKEGKI